MGTLWNVSHYKKISNRCGELKETRFNDGDGNNHDDETLNQQNLEIEEKVNEKSEEDHSPKVCRPREQGRNHMRLGYR